MATRRIPLIASYPDFTQQCELDGATYTLHFRWNQRAEHWHFDLSTVDGVPIWSGMKLVTGFPLLRGCIHAARPPGDFYVIDLQDLDAEPTFEDLGSRFALMYVEAAA